MSGELFARDGLGFDCLLPPQNATLGPLHIDYLYIHYCVFAGVPLLSAAVLLLWLGALFFFRAFDLLGNLKLLFV